MVLLLEPTGHPAAVALQQALNKDGIPLAQLYTEDIAAEFERACGPKALRFETSRRPWGRQSLPTSTIAAAISFGLSKASATRRCVLPRPARPRTRTCAPSTSSTTTA